MEYAVLISVIVLAMLAMQIMLRRAVSYRWKAAIDAAFGTGGRQYDNTSTVVTVNE